MIDDNDRIGAGSRRAFFLRGGAILGAGVATTVAAAALMPERAGPEAQVHDDREAIRQLHLAFTGLVEGGSYEAAAELFTEQAGLDLGGLRATGRSAIRELFADQYRQQKAAAMHTAYRQNALQRHDLLALSPDRRQASAAFHTEVQVSTPLQADCTAAQMARLQGQMAERRWENGRFDARYVKVQGVWKIAELRYAVS
jgi:SnoaL-like domain